MSSQTLIPNFPLSYISISSQVIDEIKKEPMRDINLLNKIQIPWWIMIHTNVPECTYYFGPFDNLEEANHAQLGYIEDLRQENAQDLQVVIKQCQPTNLTIMNE
ncbi:DUF1816 domain-containing protein [Crocosphaera sp. XPORK-15E]|uniref:DUF1816 domain-containing protein n=1 Tax=Crocosphaera sp. XPORK-15E TaxID=3110247 RepID=UPI002B210563|nr:DUF1816 domain-containing protein [Crocosphaera sp. XPORK-15E]MEA5534105.1 DUF1816 domain-containing protein [Crocosphaera sp. XPORK-15E]